jgi:hypothetical protein
MVWPGRRIDVGGVPIANTSIIAGFLYWTLDCSNNQDAHTKKQSTQPVMGNTVVPALATAGCDDESDTEEEGNTTINDNDWSKDDLNHHLRELLLIHRHPAGGLSAPPRSVAIERTPLGLAPPGGVLWTTTTTVPSVGTATTDQATAMIGGVAKEDDEDGSSPSAAISFQYESPRGGGQPSAPSLREPLLPSSLSSDGSMSTIPHVEADAEEASVHFLFQEDGVVTTTPTGESSTTTRRMMMSKDCCIAWYHCCCCCSRLLRPLAGLCFLVLLVLLLFSGSARLQHDRPEGHTTTFQPKNQAASSFWSTSCGGLDQSLGRHIRGCTTGAGHVVVVLSEEEVVEVM